MLSYVIIINKIVELVSDMKRLEVIELVEKEGINNPELANVLTNLIASELVTYNEDTLHEKIRMFLIKLKQKLNKNSRSYKKLWEK